MAADFIIATDSTADLAEEYIKKNEIEIYPLHYIIDGTEYGRELTELSNHDFYQSMRNGSMPKTSATSPEYVYNAMKKIAESGKDLLYIGFSSGLSRSYNNGGVKCKRIMEKYPDRTFLAIDTLNATVSQALIVDTAVKMRAEGKFLQETADYIHENLKNYVTTFTVDDLFHLVKGGRLNKSAAIIGTIISVKPMLKVDEKDGTLAVTGKVRGRRKAIAALCDGIETLMHEERFQGKILQAVSVAHGDCLEEAQYLVSLIKEKYGLKEVTLQELSPTLGSHAGAGTLAMGVAIL